MLVVAELNGSGNQISEGSVTDVLNKPTIIHTDNGTKTKQKRRGKLGKKIMNC